MSEIIGLKPWRSDRLWACAVGWVSDTETVRIFKTEDDVKIERINRENHESRNDIARNDYSEDADNTPIQTCWFSGWLGLNTFEMDQGPDIDF